MTTATFTNSGDRLKSGSPSESSMNQNQPAVSHHNPSVNYELQQANDTFYRGQHDVALGLFKGLTKAVPDDARVWHCKGDLHDAMGNLNDAARCYDTALEIDPTNAETWYNKGITLKNMGRDVESTTCIDHGLKLALGY